MSILRKFNSSLHDLASIRKTLKARQTDILHLPDVISMQSDIQPSSLVEITDSASKEDQTQALLRRYGADWATSVLKEEDTKVVNTPPKQFCIYCHANEDVEGTCTYGQPHEYATLEKSMIPVEDLCIRCGLHPRNPAAAINGCNHRMPQIKEHTKEELPVVHIQRSSAKFIARTPGYIGILKCNVCEEFRRVDAVEETLIGKRAHLPSYAFATCRSCENKLNDKPNADLKELKDKQTETEVKPEEKKEEPKPKKMKRWPDGHMTLQSKDLIAPIKAALEKGYRLIRRPEVKEIEYDGFNVGKYELSVMPTPRARFTKDYLEYEQKCGNTLFDVALNVLFLLGVEQGRRTERHYNLHIDRILATLANYRNSNKDLRNRIDELESYIEVKVALPNRSDKDIKPIVERMVKEKRPNRLLAIQKELESDPTAVGAVRHPHKARFSNVLSVSNVISTDTTKEQWIAYLNESGWSYEEWKRVCKKRKIKQLKFRKTQD
jgi:hypothetical protein